MATLATTVLPIASKSFTGSTNVGQSAGFAAASGGGDLIPLSGIGTILRVKTAGTACTATIDSVAPSSYGSDTNLTIVCGATDEQEIFIANDGRFDQGGANAGLAAVTYSATTNVSVAAKIVRQPT